MGDKKIIIIAVVFILLNVVFLRDGGSNPWSRLATLASLVEEENLEISEYVDPQKTKVIWTADWSQNSNGEYYSNKAPGAVFIALPFYMAIDTVLLEHQTLDRTQRDAVRFEKKELYGSLLSLCIQIPLFLICLFWGVQLVNRQFDSSPAQIFFSLALLFGNVCSLLANTYFGHALAASLALLAFLSFISAKAAFLGLFLGLALLSDYSAAFLVLMLTASFIFFSKRKFLDVLMLLQGAAVPAGIWIAYHSFSFGSPFQTALHFQNPIFLDVPAGPSFLGIFHLPTFEALRQLLWGSSRGLLMTQPWVLVLVVFWIFNFKKLKDFIPKLRLRVAFHLSLLSFLILLLSNASFGAWHGGAGPGPRYLAIGILPLSFFAACIFQYSSRLWQHVFKIALLVSLAFYSMILPLGPLRGVGPLWHEAIQSYKQATSNQLISTLLVALILGILYLKLLRRKVKNVF